MSSTALLRTDAKMVRRRLERKGHRSADTSLGTVSLHVTGNPAELEGFWKDLQARSPCTSAQTYDWARNWVNQVMRPEGREAAIVAGRAADGRSLFLWAFEIERMAGQNVLTWLGHAHANYNMGLFAPGAETFTPDDLGRLLRCVAGETNAMAAVLTAQPYSWDGTPNPFAALRHRPSPNSGYAVTLGKFDALFKARFSKRSRHTLKRKERKLAETGRLAYGWAETMQERLGLLEVFFAQKSRQLDAMGVTDPFDAHTRAFFTELALLEADNPSRLRLGYLKLDDTVIATFSGTLCHRRLGVALSSLVEGDLQRQSPGALLLKHQIEDASDEGLAFYDLGVGAARHKSEWCDVEQKLFDSFVAFKPQGLVVTLPLSLAARAKRRIKSSPKLWTLAQGLRRMLRGHAT
jgi:CelD/BcsL family acetyltransferase involved in cellulose biosynthesis